MSVTLNPGQGAFFMLGGAVNIESQLMEMKAAVRSSNASVQLALVAFASPVDGSYGYCNPIQREIPVNQWRELRLLYQAPTMQVIPALQIVVPGDAPEGSSEVYIDNLQIIPFEDQNFSPINMTVDNTFNTLDTSLTGLNINSYLPSGSIPGVISLNEGMNGQGIALHLIPEQLAAQIALFSIAPPHAGDDCWTCIC